MRRWGWVACCAFLFVVGLTVVVVAVVWQHFPPSKDFERFAAAFGGIAGAVFSAFAFAGLIVTALMQREELSLQRRELRETREELKRTADAQQKQVNIAQLAARLDAATALLNHYEVLASKLPTVLAGNPTEDMEAELRQEKDRVHGVRRELQNEIFDLRDELKGVVRRSGAATGSAQEGSGTAIMTDPDT